MIDQIIQTPIADLLRTGLLGSLLVLAGVWAWLSNRNLVNALRERADERTADWKVLADALRNNSLALNNWTLSNEARNRALEASVISQQLAASATVEQTAAFKELKEEQNDLRNDMRLVRDAILQKGGRL